MKRTRRENDILDEMEKSGLVSIDGRSRVRIVGIGLSLALPSGLPRTLPAHENNPEQAQLSSREIPSIGAPRPAVDDIIG